MRIETTLNVSLRLSLEFSLRVDSSTFSTTLLPDGMIAPSIPATDSLRIAVNLSPVLNVFVHTRAIGRTANDVPTTTVPMAGPGALPPPGTSGSDFPAPVAAGTGDTTSGGFSCEL